MVQSDREQYVTEIVTTWLVNDAPIRAEAVGILAQSRKSAAHDLGAWLWSCIRSARRGTPAWHVAQELASNDYFRIAWGEVASAISQG